MRVIKLSQKSNIGGGGRKEKGEGGLMKGNVYDCLGNELYFGRM